MMTMVVRLSRLRLWGNQNQPWLLGALLLLALLYPFVVRSYYLSLAIEVLIYAIFAMSLDLLLGYTGLPSFGHAAFLGLGAYFIAYLTSSNALALNVTDNLLLTVPAVILFVGLIALLIGWFALRTSGIYFLMITLAFAQMLNSISKSWSSVTGGSDGITGIAPPAIGLGPLSYSFSSRESFYYLVLAFVFLSYWLLRRLVNSPLGWTLQGIRENEKRMKALGYNTFGYKMAAFVIGGAFAGLAGMLLVQFFRHASPEYLHWSTSGQVMIMLIIGGAGTLVGPILGAGLVRLFPLLVSSYTDRWELLQGALFIAFVLFAPQGILGLLRRREEVEPG
ncbi:MAG: branched-chain amino acid ABC transporter permease [Anaerolineae bacterium]|nr:branched-chain amino acid ABC transporter permease [Anaerolineae bacterium]